MCPYYIRLLLDYLSILVIGQDFLSVNQSSNKCWLNAEVGIQSMFSDVLGKIRLLSHFVLTLHKYAPTYTNAQHFITAVITLNCNLSFLHVCLPNQIVCFLRILWLFCELLCILSAKYRLWHIGAQFVELMNGLSKYRHERHYALWGLTSLLGEIKHEVYNKYKILKKRFFFFWFFLRETLFIGFVFF